MTKYIAEDPKEQPIHDMMDDIEIAYQKAEKAGGHPLKIALALHHMILIYKDEHPELEEHKGDLSVLVEALKEIRFKKGGE